MDRGSTPTTIKPRHLLPGNQGFHYYHTIITAPTTRQPRLPLLSFHHQGIYHCQALTLEVSTITKASTKVHTNTKASTSNQGSYFYQGIFQGTFYYIDIHQQVIYHWKAPYVKAATIGTCISRHPSEYYYHLGICQGTHYHKAPSLRHLPSRHPKATITLGF